MKASEELHEQEQEQKQDSESDASMASASDSEEEVEELPEAPHAPVHHTSAAGNEEDEEFKISAIEGRVEPMERERERDREDPEQQEESALNYNRNDQVIMHGISQIMNYEIERKIGSGTFGEVSLGRDKRNGTRVALKRILFHNQKEGMPMTAMREIRILKKLSHPNIIKLREMAVKKGQRGKERASHYMVFPYMEHDLDGLLQNPQVKFSVEQVKSYMQQLLRGIEHLHLNAILHRDIKSANILISNSGYLKVADFGLARPFNPNGGGKYTNMVVTRWFRPPELLMGATTYNGAVDMWGVGCVFGEILKRRAILPGTSDMDQLTLIWQLCGTPRMSNWPGKGYLEYPMFAEGRVRDFDEASALPRTLEEKFPSHHFRKETFNLLDDLLAICPERRMTATEALNAKYFKVPPYPAKPGTNEFSNYFADSHELDSRNAKASRVQSKAKFILHNHHDVIRPRKPFFAADLPSAPAVMKRPLELESADCDGVTKKRAIGIADGGL